MAWAVLDLNQWPLPCQGTLPVLHPLGRGPVPARPAHALAVTPWRARLRAGRGSRLPGRHKQGGQAVIAWPVSGSKKYRWVGSTVKVTRPPGLTGVCGSILAMPLGALPTRKPASADSSAAADAAAAWAAGVASSQK